MSNTYRVVNLLKNHLYPTYQLHAFMCSDRTDPRDGLRLAALTTMHWLKTRLGAGAPADWNTLPSPEEYLSASDDDLPSLYLNQGHVINIVSLPDKGMWTLQITEPDLGSDPGKPHQTRPAVPGRIIETNIAFQIVGKDLEFGCKTVISDPVGTTPEAEVYRLAVIRQLMQNPAFGLKQVTRIPMNPVRLTNGAQVKTMLFIRNHADNDLPAVIFTQPQEIRKEMPILSDISKLSMRNSLTRPSINLDLSGLDLPKSVPSSKPEVIALDPPYDLEKFCYYTFSHCRTYILEQTAEKSFKAQSGLSFRPGEIMLLYPSAHGGGEKLFPDPASEDDRSEMIKAIEHDVKDYPKSHPISFGKIVFLSEARQHLLRLSDELLESAETADARFRQELAQINTTWQDALSKKDRELETVSAQLQRQKEYTAQVQSEKATLREAFSLERDRLLDEIASREAMITFLRRRNDQPRSYDGISPWVSKYFGNRLILHPKAIARMMTKSCQCASVELICDALDYLATDYWEQRYESLPKETALTRCSQKYGRPFEIKPTGQVTIEYTPEAYKIRYYTDAQGHETDSDLDYHLRVGNAPENLLRIYFLHDDERQLIVVGSLPDHLRTVTIQ